MPLTWLASTYPVSPRLLLLVFLRLPTIPPRIKAPSQEREQASIRSFPRDSAPSFQVEQQYYHHAQNGENDADGDLRRGVGVVKEDEHHRGEEGEHTRL